MAKIIVKDCQGCREPFIAENGWDNYCKHCIGVNQAKRERKAHIEFIKIRRAENECYS